MSDVLSAPRRLLRCAPLLPLLALAGCSADKPAAAAPPKVGTLTLTARSLPLEQTLPGRSLAFEVSEVRPQVDGIVRQRLFTEGQQVAAGQVLYQVDPAPYQAALDAARGQLAQAEAALTTARLKAARYHTLLGVDAVSRQDADDAAATLQQDQAAVTSARAALESARINLGYTRILAPIAGRIGTSSVTAGALVTAHQDAALATIQRLDPIYLDVSQSSLQLLALRKQLADGRIKAVDGKAQVKVLLEDGSAYAHPGTLEFTGTSVDTGTGNVTLRAVIPNPEHLLLPGMYLRAVLPLADDDQAILVPQQAVTRDAKGEPEVKLLGPGDTVVERRIATAEVVGHDWRVTSGLKPGDRLLVVNAGNAAVGAKVRPYPVTEARLDPAAAGND